MIALEEAKDTASHSRYALRMAEKRARPHTADTVSKNLRSLTRHAGWNQSELARRSGVSQRHISDILAGNSTPTVSIADQLATPFGLTGWHLLLPNLPVDLVASPAIGKLVEAYLKADAVGREFLDAAAAREMKRTP